MNQLTSRKIARKAPAKANNFHGASIVDASGNETPITEAMIQLSLTKLIRDWEKHQRMPKR